jgi:hypothetical protein
MAEESWIDRTLDRVKEIPVIGGAAAWVADRRETRRQDDAFAAEVSTHYRDQQLDTWRAALPPTERDVRAEFERQEEHNERLIQAHFGINGSGERVRGEEPGVLKQDAAKAVWDAPTKQNAQPEQSPKLRVNMQF